MNYNNYFGGIPQYPTYNAGNNFLYQNAYRQPQSMSFDTNTSPIQDIKFVTKKQADGYIAMPNSSTMLIDRENKIAYIRSANNMGEQFSSMYKYEPINDNSQNNEENKTSVIDTSKFLTEENTKDFLKKEDLKDFLKKEDLKTIDDKLDYLEKQIKINNILKGEDKGNGQ